MLHHNSSTCIEKPHEHRLVRTEVPSSKVWSSTGNTCSCSWLFSETINAGSFTSSLELATSPLFSPDGFSLRWSTNEGLAYELFRRCLVTTDERSWNHLLRACASCRFFSAASRLSSSSAYAYIMNEIYTLLINYDQPQTTICFRVQTSMWSWFRLLFFCLC